MKNRQISVTFFRTINIDFVVAAFFDVRSVLPALSLQCWQDC